MDLFYVLLVITFFIHLIGVLSIQGFNPYIFKYGLEINNLNLGKMEILNFSEKIGIIYEKKHSMIKVISQNEFYIVPKYHPYIRRLIPYCINICVHENEEYKVISKIQLTYLIFPIMTVIFYLLEREINLIIVFMFLFFLTVTLIANNWIMKFIINDVKEFINGIEL